MYICIAYGHAYVILHVCDEQKKQMAKYTKDHYIIYKLERDDDRSAVFTSYL